MSEDKKAEETPEVESGETPETASVVCPTESMLETLDEGEWPPVVNVDKEVDFKLTELDISWTLCTVLGMSWKDAVSVDDEHQRKFLYSKALVIAEGMQKAQAEAEERKQQMEREIRSKLDAQADEYLANNPAIHGSPPSDVGDFAKFNL